MKTFDPTRMKLLAMVLVTICSGNTNLQAQTFQKNLKSFDKIVISPRINVELIKSDREFVEIKTNGIEAEKVEVRVNGNTLHMYLPDSKINDKTYTVREYGWKRRLKVYEGVTVDATIYFKELSRIEVRGNQEISCNDLLNTDKFTIKQYGESRMTLSELKCEKLKVSLYGENTLKISAGESTEQIVKLFGDNFMDTGGLNSQYVKANSYGESEARIQSQAIVRVSSLGESKLYISGKAHIEKGLIIGENRIRRVY